MDGAGAQAPSVHGDPRSHTNSSTSSARSTSRGDVQYESRSSELRTHQGSKSTASDTWQGVSGLDYDALEGPGYVNSHTSWAASSAPAYSMASSYGLGSSAATSGQSSAQSMYYPETAGSTGYSVPYSSSSIPSIAGASGGVPQYDLPPYHYPPSPAPLSPNPYTLPTDYRSSLYPELSYSRSPNSWDTSPAYDSNSHTTRRHLTPDPLPQPMLSSSSLYDPYNAPSAMASTSAATTVASPSAIGASSRYPGSRSNSTLYDDPHGSSVENRYYEDSGKYRSLSTSKTSHRRHK